MASENRSFAAMQKEMGDAQKRGKPLSTVLNIGTTYCNSWTSEINRELDELAREKAQLDLFKKSAPIEYTKRLQEYNQKVARVESSKKGLATSLGSLSLARDRAKTAPK